MTLPELLDALTQDTLVKKTQAREILDRLTALVQEGLVKEGAFTLYGLGTWRVMEVDARTGRNPQTGEPMDIPAKKRVKFQATKTLKDAVNG